VGHRGIARAVSAAMALAVVAAACTGSAKPRPSPTIATAAPAECPPNTGPIIPLPGSSTVFAAEQWPDCLNPITDCAASAWTRYTVLEHVLPRAMQVDLTGNFVASPMLVDAPSLANGELSLNPFTVRFHISPDAVWADQTPITSEDFAFTWRAILNTTRARDTQSYAHISRIDATDPATAVIRFKDVYANWPDLFGGARGFVLEAAAFPRFAGKPNPDLKNEMATEIPFSGGPFILKSWSKDQAVLVRNDHYFEKVANFDQVTFVPRIDQHTEIQSLLTGEVGAIYPQPFDTSLLDAMRANPCVKAVGGNGTYADVLLFDHPIPPLDDPLVREALIYAIDRQSVVDEIIKLNNPDAEVLNCGLVAIPGQGPWCDSTPFEQFIYDPERAKSILESDGYDCSSTPCTKDGESLLLLFLDGERNSGRTAPEELLVRAALDAGFELHFSGAQFGDVPMNGIFLPVDTAQGAPPDPVTSLFDCKGIPEPEVVPLIAGWVRWCNVEADALRSASDREIDPATRVRILDLLYELEVRDFVSLPLYVVPVVTAWRIDQIAGPIGLYSSSPYGLFFNMNDWQVVTT
jgi:ABC-type transport system substrate-binding protein